MRHLVSHFIFLLSACCLYILISKIYKSTFLASSAFLMLVCNPRIYAHSFFNTKDIPFLSFLVIALLLFYLAQKEKKTIHIVLFGIICGLLINIRVIGIIVPIFYISTNIISLLKKKSLNGISKILLFKIVVFATLYISWPFLWSDPLENFIAAIENMSKFRWNDTMTFFGESILATKAPWFYIPVYFLITTPIIYSLIFLLGIIVSICNLWGSSYLKKELIILNLTLFFSPQIAIITLQSTVYDGWRQLYFIYVPFIIISINGLHFIYKHLNSNHVRYATTAVFIIIISIMIKLHPFQNVYFNSIFINEEENYFTKNFDFDYWGTSYYEAYEYILKHSQSHSINVSTTDDSGKKSLAFLKDYQRARLNYIEDWESADYLITTYRFYPNLLPEYENYKVFELKRMNSTVYSIYKFK